MLSSGSVPAWVPEASSASILHGVSQGMELLRILALGTENFEILNRSYIKWMVNKEVAFLEDTNGETFSICTLMIQQFLFSMFPTFCLNTIGLELVI